ncbi:hypothetical protein Hypma_012113 [Hypsizygus marmoreus]|uniref:Uncharacterized protein n=1 Tax=Hypsizygus marmoreus TaxID=39966 RepID=A0A369JLS5_HYPMA|nr:hypothetical protein Hypma_012113 [Hypsizygus marmoreus]
MIATAYSLPHSNKRSPVIRIELHSERMIVLDIEDLDVNTPSGNDNDDRRMVSGVPCTDNGIPSKRVKALHPTHDIVSNVSYGR